MIDRALWMMLGLVMFTFLLLGMQYLIGDVFGFDIPVQCTDADLVGWVCSDYYGTPIKSSLIGYLNMDVVTGLLDDSLSGSDGTFDRIIGFALAAAYVAWNLIAILSGITIFQLLWFLGVPIIIVSGIALIYYIFLARAILGYVRGV